MPRLQRIAIVLGLWLLAGILCAIFSEIGIEAGESETMALLQFVFLTPLLAAAGIAAAVAPDHYHTWQQRDFHLSVVWWFVMACFVTHAVVALTRRDRRQFIALVALQIVVLGVSVCRVISFLPDLAKAGL